MQTSFLNRPLNRRTFLQNSAIALVTASLAQTALSMGHAYAAAPAAHRAQVNMDLDILNYALTLEHLEAEAYRVVNASGLLTGPAVGYFADFGAHEAAHVVALTQTITDLGGTPVAKAASYAFPTFTSSQEIVEFFQSVEELGAAAYLGQAPRLVNPDLITAAVAIHNVEAQHAAVLSDLIGVAPAPAFAQPKSMEEVLMVVTPIIMPAAQMPAAMPRTGRGLPARQGIMAATFGNQ
jgi:hypothetical protein